MNRKRVLTKTILIYDWNKVYYLENWSKKTSTWKTDYLFNALAILETDRWIFWLRNGNHNHKITLFGIHSI